MLYQKMKEVGWKYRLYQNEIVQTPVMGHEIMTQFIHLTEDGTMTLMAGYCWNGATIVPDTKKSLPASLPHDAFYQLILENHLPMAARILADQLFRDMLIERSMVKWIARLYYRALRKGWPVFNKIFRHRKTKIHEVL